MKTIDFEGVRFRVRIRPVKHARIEFRMSGPRIIVPRFLDAERILRDNRRLVLKKIVGVRKNVSQAEQLPLFDRSETDLFRLVDFFVRRYSRKLRVKPTHIKYRTMKRRWGSCRTQGILTFNRVLKHLPEILIAFVVFHELAHLRVMGHQKDFKEIIRREFSDFRRLDRELNLYGLRLLSVD